MEFTIPQLEVADRVLRRMRGLLGRDGLDPDQGLLIEPTNSVHTAFMRFPIDVVFLDCYGLVVGVVHELPPWRLAWRRGARAALELPAGTALELELREGDLLVRPRRRPVGAPVRSGA